MPTHDTPDDAVAEKARKQRAAKLKRLRKATRGDPSIRPCCRCLEIKPVGEFSKANPARCRVCVNVVAREKRSLNPGSVYYNERYRLRRKMLDEIKDRPCADCGGRFPPYVMDFDHRDPRQKSAGVSHFFSANPDRLQAEIDKCDVVCSNCHRIRTHHQRQARLFPQPGRTPLRDYPKVAHNAGKRGRLGDMGGEASLSVPEAADYLRMSRVFVYKHQAELGGFKVGAAVRFRLSGLTNYLDRHQIQPPTPRPKTVD